MKLFIYEHCPFCARARMVFGLKNLVIEEQVVLEDDAETLIARVGKKTVPVLQKADGSFMAESLDIVRYINGLYPTPALAEPDHEVEAWCELVWPQVLKLSIPRFTQADFNELASDSARQAYKNREQKAFGNLEALLSQTCDLLNALQPYLDQLETSLAYERPLGLSDFKLYPILRMLSIVSGVQWGPRTLAYMQSIAQRSRVPLHLDQAF